MIGFPFEPFTAPSQSPVPVGLTPDWKPNAGVSASIWANERPFTPLGLLLAGGAEVAAGAGADEEAGGTTPVVTGLDAAGAGAETDAGGA